SKKLPKIWRSSNFPAKSTDSGREYFTGDIIKRSNYITQRSICGFLGGENPRRGSLGWSTVRRMAAEKRDRTGPKAYFLPAASPGASCIFTILSGSVTEPLAALSPFLILSTTSMPEVTSPTTVYLLFRNGASAKQMKNCEFAELGSAARAMPTV